MYIHTYMHAYIHTYIHTHIVNLNRQGGVAMGLCTVVGIDYNLIIIITIIMIMLQY